MPTNREVSIRGGYQPFQLKRDYHLDIFGNTLDKITQQHEKAVEQRAAIQSALSNIKLNAAEDEWKQNYINDINKQIDNAAQFGNYSTALTTATRLAGEAMSNPALRGRMRANEQYEEEIKRQKARVDRGDISQNTYAWWLKNNPYQYSDIKDDNGNIIGGTEYEPTSRPVNDINWASAAMAAFKMVTPYKNSTSSQGGSSVTNHTTEPLTRGNQTYKPGESISSTGGRSSSEEKVTKDQIVARMEELLTSTPDGYRQAEQAYDVANFEFNNMVEQYNKLVIENSDSQEAKDLAQKIDARKQLMYRNGSRIDYKEYYARMITESLYAEGLAYDWKTTSTSGTTNYSITDLSGGRTAGSTIQSPNYFPGAKFNYTSGLWEGANVRQQVNTEGAQQSVSTAASDIDNRFKKK